MVSNLSIPFPTHVQSVAIDQRQWEALMSDVATATVSFQGQERRIESRHDLRQVMQMFVGIGMRNPQRFLVRTRNISKHGVGFIHSRPARRGMRCSLAIVSSDNKLVHMKATIASSRARPDGHYDVGVKFDKPVILDDFLTLVPISNVI